MEFVNPQYRKEKAKEQQIINEILKEKGVISDAEIKAKKESK